jgi:hypothetical protein
MNHQLTKGNKMSTDEKPNTPAERAGKIPGIMWESLFNKMGYHISQADGLVASAPDQAKAELADLSTMVQTLRDYIIDGKE